MKYRILGSTGMRVSVVGVGAWQFGGEWGHDYTEAEVDAVLGAARECGINLLDTAECYGDHLSERLCGARLARERDHWIVATKFGHRFHAFMNRTEHWTAAEVLQSLDESLRALRTDHVDLLQFHSGNNAVFDNDELWAMLNRQVEAGKVRALGISINKKDGPSQVDQATRVGARVIQVIYNRLDRDPEHNVFPSCQRQNLGVLARVPLASGFLSGKYRPGTRFTGNDFRKTMDAADVDAKLRAVEDIARTEVPPGVDMATWALAWGLQHPAVTAVIPGCKSPEQVRANAAAAALDLVRDDHPMAVR